MDIEGYVRNDETNNPIYFTPLIVAIKQNNIEIIKFLLDNGSDPNLPSFWLINRELEKVMNYVQSYEEILGWREFYDDFYVKENFKYPLEYALNNANFETVKLLIWRGANINLLNKKYLLNDIIYLKTNEKELLKCIKLLLISEFQIPRNYQRNCVSVNILKLLDNINDINMIFAFKDIMIELNNSQIIKLKSTRSVYNNC